MSAPVDLVLSRLDNPRPTGKDRWRCACPSCGGNRSGFSVGVGDDEAVLVKCWKGCSTDAVVHAMGLELTDLFPPRPSARGRSPTQRRRLISAGQALDVLAFEATVTATAAGNLAHGVALTAEDRQRLFRAAGRILAIAQEVRA